MEEGCGDHGMDLSKVSVVRSAKGVDMLCVDDYLYHFDCIGKNNTYRWLCNRRKDKISPCKSRICTILPNGLDKTRHVVVDVPVNHIHPRCSDHEVSKVAHRKRIAIMKKNDAYSSTQPKRARQYERATGTLNTPPEFIYNGASTDTSLLDTTFHVDFEEKDRVYMMRRRDGRVMVCIDGHLYYLGGKSNKGEIYRWTCVRHRDIECTTKICTEATLDGAHRLHMIETDAHIHPHYSADKLMQMFAKHKILLVENDQTNEVLQECPNIEYFDPEQTVDPSQCDDIESLIIEDCEESYDVYMDDEQSAEISGDLEDYQTEAEQRAELHRMPILYNRSIWPVAHDVIANYVQEPGYEPLTETNLTKFTFLPSAKGRKVLCLNRYLYHFDSQSKSNGHMFFTCIMRRHKHLACHVRVTLTPIGPMVLRINGQHTHNPDLKEIERRLAQQAKIDLETPTEPQQHLAESDIIEYESEEDVGHQSADGSYEQLEKNNPEAQGEFVMKKVISIDGDIKMEPTTKSMVMQYVEYGADNLSAKIEIVDIMDGGTYTHTGSRNNTSTPLPKIPPQPEITNIRRRRDVMEPQKTLLQPDMDLSKICTLRSAKGSELLCVDGYIYHAKNRGVISRNYWVCIKSRDPGINCKSRISTATQKDGSIRVLRVYNVHTHPFSEDDIKRRLFNEINKKHNKKLKFRPLHFIGKSLDEIQQEYGDLAVERLSVSNISNDIMVQKKPRVPSPSKNGSSRASVTSTTKSEPPEEGEDVNVVDEGEEQHEQVSEIDGQYIEMEHDNTDAIIEVVEEAADEMENYAPVEPAYPMKLYAVSDGPPSLAVRMTMKALDIEYQLINVDFCALEHRTEDYAKMNPQKEIPVLDDDGFYLSESIAIMQYLCDKYAASSSTLYPQDVNHRALVNQRLCFNMGFYYAPISAHSMAPIFFDYERTPMSLKKVKNALEVFETYLERLGSKYAAGDDVTIADFSLISATICLEAIDFDLSPYPLVNKWYNNFKEEYPQLWEIANSGMQEINAFEHNPPDLSEMEHPFHPTRKAKA
ncbi:uncharacterized protein LOC117588487 [Drosophila guanche]|uniref:Blast:Glutathione S-transferase 1-1 n=1 Tax=Drosophila guanche TaxID=7266 RepID=A0A3B0KKW1_DROGU|nr:uncharacterized protein LOC117588487 [Drosophila guanche]SPP86436.1 blast:Glutathione S-transferase 1-1 [Drosophila guanche]